MSAHYWCMIDCTLIYTCILRMSDADCGLRFTTCIEDRECEGRGGRCIHNGPSLASCSIQYHTMSMLAEGKQAVHMCEMYNSECLRVLTACEVYREMFVAWHVWNSACILSCVTAVTRCKRRCLWVCVKAHCTTTTAEAHVCTIHRPGAANWNAIRVCILIRCYCYCHNHVSLLT